LSPIHLYHLRFILVYTRRFHKILRSCKFGLKSRKGHGKVMERSWKGHGKVMKRSWESIGQHVYEPCINVHLSSYIYTTFPSWSILSLCCLVVIFVLCHYSINTRVTSFIQRLIKSILSLLTGGNPATRCLWPQNKKVGPKGESYYFPLRPRGKNNTSPGSGCLTLDTSFTLAGFCILISPSACDVL